MVRGGSAAAAAAGGEAEGGEIDATLLWCDLERSPNLRYDLSLTDFQPTCGFNHPPRAVRTARPPADSFHAGSFRGGRWGPGHQRRTMRPKSVPVN